MAFSKSLSLNGGSQYAYRAYTPALNLVGTDLTIEAWIRIPSQPGGTYPHFPIASMYEASGTQGWYFIYSRAANADGVLQFGGNINNGNAYPSIYSPIKVNRWTHVAVTYKTSSGEIEVFKDGVSQGTTTTNSRSGGVSTSNNQFFIGAAHSSWPLFEGNISLVRLWNRARTQSEIANNMCNVLGPTTNLVAEYTLDDTFNDSGGGSYTLTAASGAGFTTQTPGLCVDTLNHGLRAAYNLDGNSNDATGNGYNGNDTNIAYNSSYGKIGQGAAVTSTSASGISINTATLNLTRTGDFAVSFWFYGAAPGSGDYPGLFAHFLDSSPFPGPTIFFDPLGVSSSGDGIIFRVTGTNEHKVTSPSASSLYGKYTHIIFQRKSGVCEIYYDGTQVSTFNDSTNLPDASVAYIYSRYNYNVQTQGTGARGDIYNIWDRALSAPEISRLYNSGSAIQYPFPEPVAVEQTAFRFRNDNGSESAATWMAAQNAGSQSNIDLNRRLRIQLDSDGGDPASASYGLEYRKEGETTWLPVTSIVSQAAVGQQLFETSGSFVVPAGVTSISVVGVGAGGGGSRTTSAGGGGTGGDLRYYNNLSVTPGETLTITVGVGGEPGSSTGQQGGYTRIARGGTTLLEAAGGGGGTTAPPTAKNGTSTTIGGSIGGGDGGNGATASGSTSAGSGGGAGGYAGNGGNGVQGNSNGNAGSGGAGGSGAGNGSGDVAAGGGGVGLMGQGSNGAAGTTSNRSGKGGSGGEDAKNTNSAEGGKYGGGGGGDDNNGGGMRGADGGVRIIWGAGRSFPSTLTSDQTPQEYAKNAVVLSTSSNIASGAATSTTAQLTPPTGKTSGDFTTGKISDDTNPITVDIGDNDYTELEWCIKLSTEAEVDAEYEFRVVSNGTPLSTYLQTPVLKYVPVQLPTVATNPTTNIGETTADGNGDVTDDGEGTITRRGFVFGTSVLVAPPAVTRVWFDVAYGNGLFVAVALNGIGDGVMTSPDGINWTTRSVPVDNQWRAITYGNGLFVAVASTGTATNRVMTSPDGINWTIRTSARGAIWRSVTYGNGLFVAVASSGVGNRVMTSPDGSNWTLRTSAADNQWWSVVYGNGLFVAVAIDGSGNRVMTSPDGINWTIRTSAADNSWRSVTYGNGLFVAVASDGTGNRVMTSPDGTSWTVRNSASDDLWYSVAFGNGIFVAAPDVPSVTGNFMMSLDGVTWTSSPSSLPYGWNSIVWGDGKFVAVSYTSSLGESRTVALEAYQVSESGSFGEGAFSLPLVKNSEDATTTTPPGTGSNNSSNSGTLTWETPGNITTASDSAYTTAIVGTTFKTQFLRASNFGFVIPPDAVVTGVEAAIRLDRRDTPSGAKLNQLRLVKNGASISGHFKEGQSLDLNEVIYTQTYGSNTDTWGDILTPADINSSDFGVVMEPSYNYPDGSIRVFQVHVTIYYTTPGPLDPETTYYVRAFAQNEAGYSYGDEESFTTLGPVEIPGVYNWGVKIVG